MPNGSGDIVIKGGSCEIYFDHSAFQKDPNDPNKRKYARNIKRVVITGGDKAFDTGDLPEGFKGTITVHCD